MNGSATNGPSCSLIPKDFTPVCTTELGYLAKIKPEFDWRGVKIISLSVDPVQSHTGWVRDIKETQGFAPTYPLISDTELKVAKLYGMLPAEMPAARPAGRCRTSRRCATSSSSGRTSRSS